MLLGCSPHAQISSSGSRGLKAQVYHKSLLPPRYPCGLCGPATTMGPQHLLCVCTWCRAQSVASVGGCLSAAAIPTRGGCSCDPVKRPSPRQMSPPSYSRRTQSRQHMWRSIFFLTCIAPCVKTQSSASLSSSWSKGIR